MRKGKASSDLSFFCYTYEDRKNRFLIHKKGGENGWLDGWVNRVEVGFKRLSRAVAEELSMNVEREGGKYTERSVRV